MKNRAHILVVTVAYIAFNVHSLNGMNPKNIVEIGKLKQEKVELLEEIRLCSGVNIGLGVVGVGAGISSGLGFFFKDSVLEVVGIIGSTLTATLVIATNCMLCCQNPVSRDEYEGYGNL